MNQTNDPTHDDSAPLRVGSLVQPTYSDDGCTGVILAVLPADAYLILWSHSQQSERESARGIYSGDYLIEDAPQVSELLVTLVEALGAARARNEYAQEQQRAHLVGEHYRKKIIESCALSPTDWDQVCAQVKHKQARLEHYRSELEQALERNAALNDVLTRERARAAEDAAKLDAEIREQRDMNTALRDTLNKEREAHKAEIERLRAELARCGGAA